MRTVPFILLVGISEPELRSHRVPIQQLEEPFMDLSLIITIVAAIAGILALLIDVLSKNVRILIVTVALFIVFAGLLVTFNPLQSGRPHAGVSSPAPTRSVPTTGSARPTLLPPSAEPVSNWTPFGPDIEGFAIQKSGNNLVINTPASYYARMLGAFSVQGNICDFDLKFEASATGDTASSGYGYAIVPRANLINGVPSGWSLQVEWDGTKGGYYYRHVILPQQASQPTDDFYLGSSSLGKIAWEIKGDGSQIDVFLNGKLIPWDPQYPTATCGNGLAFRVWGGAATFSDIDLTQSPS
jgi:hypothetical protein